MRSALGQCLRSRQASQWTLAFTLILAATVLASRYGKLPPLPPLGVPAAFGPVLTVSGAGEGECPRCEAAAAEVEPPPAPRNVIVPKGRASKAFTPDAVNLPPELLWPELQPPPKPHTFLSPDSPTPPPERACPTRYVITNPWWYSRHHNNIISMQRALLFAMYLNRTLVIDGGWRLFESTMDIRRMGWCVFSMAEWGAMMEGNKPFPGVNGTDAAAQGVAMPKKVMCFLWNVEGHGHCNNDFWDWPAKAARPQMVTIRLDYLEVHTHHVHPYRHIARAMLSVLNAAEADPETADAVGTVNMHFTYFTGVSKFTSREIWMHTRPTLGWRRLVIDMMECFFVQKKWLRDRQTPVATAESAIGGTGKADGAVKAQTRQRLAKREETISEGKAAAVEASAETSTVQTKVQDAAVDESGPSPKDGSSDVAGGVPDEKNTIQDQEQGKRAEAVAKDQQADAEAKSTVVAAPKASTETASKSAAAPDEVPDPPTTDSLPEEEEDTDGAAESKDVPWDNAGPFKMPNLTYVGIHHRQLEGGCYLFGSKYPGSLNTTAMERICDLDMDYMGKLVEEADPSIDWKTVPIFLASDGQKPETEAKIRRDYPNVVMWGNARCSKTFKRAGAKHLSSAVPDLAWMDAMLLVGSTVFIGQIGSSFSANVAIMREADGRPERSNILAGYKESGYRVLNGLSATDD